ncbi:MAG TPA: HAD hydrolase family protein [Nevskiaceae bacterium]|nr:HAD hydrolase family protein [Nevskiaceae bacterium]
MAIIKGRSAVARKGTGRTRITSLAEVKRRAANIRCLFLDIDGVMTDCKLYLTPDGEELKAVNVKDGLGIKMLMQAGVQVAVISGRPSLAMQKRLSSLGIEHVFLNAPDKLPAYDEVRKSLGLRDEQCAHMGDDILDLPLFERVGLALAVADAHSSAKKAADWIADNRGGDGAIREAVDLILEAQGKSP